MYINLETTDTQMHYHRDYCMAIVIEIRNQSPYRNSQRSETKTQFTSRATSGSFDLVDRLRHIWFDMEFLFDGGCHRIWCATRERMCVCMYLRCFSRRPFSIFIDRHTSHDTTHMRNHLSNQNTKLTSQVLLC